MGFQIHSLLTLDKKLVGIRFKRQVEDKLFDAGVASLKGLKKDFLKGYRLDPLIEYGDLLVTEEERDNGLVVTDISNDIAYCTYILSQVFPSDVKKKSLAIGDTPISPTVTRLLLGIKSIETIYESIQFTSTVYIKKFVFTKPLGYLLNYYSGEFGFVSLTNYEVLDKLGIDISPAILEGRSSHGGHDDITYNYKGTIESPMSSPFPSYAYSEASLSPQDHLLILTLNSGSVKLPVRNKTLIPLSPLSLQELLESNFKSFKSMLKTFKDKDFSSQKSFLAISYIDAILAIMTRVKEIKPSIGVCHVSYGGYYPQRYEGYSRYFTFDFTTMTFCMSSIGVQASLKGGPSRFD